MKIIYKSNQESKQRGLRLDRQRVLLKEKRKCFNLKLTLEYSECAVVFNLVQYTLA